MDIDSSMELLLGIVDIVKEYDMYRDPHSFSIGS